MQYATTDSFEGFSSAFMMHSTIAFNMSMAISIIKCDQQYEMESAKLEDGLKILAVFDTPCALHAAAFIVVQ